MITRPDAYPGLTLDMLRRLIEVAYAAPEEGFVALVGLAELDPRTAFRGARLRGLDLRGQDLSGFDLSDAELIDCRLEGANLSHAIGVTPNTIVNSISGIITKPLYTGPNRASNSEGFRHDSAYSAHLCYSKKGGIITFDQYRQEFFEKHGRLPHRWEMPPLGD